MARPLDTRFAVEVGAYLIDLLLKYVELVQEE